MNAKTWFVFVGFCWLSLVLAHSGHSELVQTINIHLVARVTTQVTTNGDTRVERMKIVRITTKEILEMLGKATTNDFKGTTLVCINRGEAYQVRRGTNVVADVSVFFTDEGFSPDVIDQNFDSRTGKDSYHGFWLRTIGFDDHRGNTLTLSGMIEEHYTANIVDSDGMQAVSDLESFNCSGNGTLSSGSPGQGGDGTDSGQFALFSGTILLNGKGVVPLNTF